MRLLTESKNEMTIKYNMQSQELDAVKADLKAQKEVNESL